MPCAQSRAVRIACSSPMRGRAGLPDRPGRHPAGFRLQRGLGPGPQGSAHPPAQYRSPLARRPYDLRHAAESLWLNSGVPATEVARLGHGVAVLLKIYAHCIDGQATAANQRIADALGTQDAEQDPVDEDNDNIEQAS